MMWRPHHCRAVAQTLHVASLAGMVGPGYARRDATLRRGAGHAPAELGALEVPLRGALATALRDGQSPWDELDSAWFSQRWSMGEEAAVQTQSAALVASLEALALPEGLCPATQVQTSTALGAQLITAGALVVAGPSAPPRN